jgi:hypothetical protein
MNNTGRNKSERTSYNLKLFTLKHELLKISVRSQTAFAAETCPAEGQWLEEQANMLKLRMFRVGI